jgi:cell division septum initiation protein DivIVA
MAEQPAEADDLARVPHVEELLGELDRIVADARSMPLSSSVVMNRAEVAGLLARLRDQLPDELGQARWVIRERDEILEHARADAEQLLAEARQERDLLVSEQHVTKVALEESERIVEAAHETARQLRLEAEDYVDAKLANFEVVLNKTLTAVERGRERLRGRLETDDLAADLDAADDEFDEGGYSGLGGR